jgi:APA family basic amino acid/polyamine antiporter
MIGWDLILEYAVGSMTVAIGWSGYMQRLMAGFGINLPASLAAAPPVGIINLPAVIIVLLIMVLLVIGIRESARFNAMMVAIKLAAVLFFLAAGITYVEPANWQPFAPYGWPGIMAAAAVVFFAYIGFDAVSTTAEEAKNPQRDLPIGIIASLVVCTVLYLAVGAVLTGMVPVVEYRALADALPGVAMVDQTESVKFLNAPVAFALSVIGQDWAAGLVSAGAVAGITSVLLVMLMSQPRIFFAMSRDNLLPQGVSKVHPKFGTPYITTIITCVIVAIVAGVTQIQVVGEMTSIGTLFAFVVVCAAVLMLRAKRPEAKRPFRVPLGPVFPVLGILSCAYLMLSLPVLTWVRFLVWLDIGMVIYWFYGRTHSPLGTGRSVGAHADAVAGQLHQHAGPAAPVQRRLHGDPRLHDGVRHHQRDNGQMERDRRTAEEADAFGLRFRSPVAWAVVWPIGGPGEKRRGGAMGGTATGRNGLGGAHARRTRAADRAIRGSHGRPPGLGVVRGQQSGVGDHVRNKIATSRSTAVAASCSDPDGVAGRSAGTCRSPESRRRLDGIPVQLPFPGGWATTPSSVSSMPSTLPRTWTASIPPMWACSCRSGRRSSRARLWGAPSCWTARPSPCEAGTPWSSAAATSLGNRWRCCCSTGTRPSRSVTPEPWTFRQCAARPTCWWRRSAARAS